MTTTDKELEIWEERFRAVFRMPVAYGDVTDGKGNVLMKHQVVERGQVRDFIRDLLSSYRTSLMEKVGGMVREKVSNTFSGYNEMNIEITTYNEAVRDILALMQGEGGK